MTLFKILTLSLASAPLARQGKPISDQEFAGLKKWASYNNINIERDLNDDSCAWTTGDFGEMMTCPDMYSTFGLCSSGGNYDCGVTGEAWKLHCCNFQPSGSTENCRITSSNTFGEELNCAGGNNLMNGACTSGRLQDCNGKRSTHELVCCDYPGLSASGSVYTVNGGFGQDIDCPSGYLVTGYCASGGKGNECTDSAGKTLSHYINCQKWSNE